MLNVNTLRRAAGMIGTQITMYVISNAMHDIFLSKKLVREKAFDLMFQWLRHLEEDWVVTRKF